MTGIIILEIFSKLFGSNLFRVFLLFLLTLYDSLNIV